MMKLQYFGHLMRRTDSLKSLHRQVVDSLSLSHQGSPWRKLLLLLSRFSRVQLWDPMDRSTPGFRVHHQPPELTQTHVHWVGDAIQPSHPLSSPSPLAFNLSQHQGNFPMSQFFASGGQSIRVSALASVLPMNIQDWFPLGWAGSISLQSKRL